MTVAYRDATIADAVILADIGARTFIATFRHLYSAANLAIFLDNHTPERWAAALGGTARVRLAEVDGAAIGYARLDTMLLPVEPAGRSPAHLYQLYVDPPWQGAGVAAALLDWTIAAARDGGADDLWLSVYVENPRARKFYAKRGFVEVMPYTFMVGDHADDDIICRLALDALASG